MLIFCTFGIMFDYINDVGDYWVTCHFLENTRKNSPITCRLASGAFWPEPARWQGPGYTQLPGVTWKHTPHRIIVCTIFCVKRTLRIRLLHWVDYFNHVCQICHDKKKTNKNNLNIGLYLSHIYNVSSLEWTYGIFGAQGELLHVRNKRLEFKCELIAILTIPVITSKRVV